jgi:hypothetical protein
MCLMDAGLGATCHALKEWTITNCAPVHTKEIKLSLTDPNKKLLPLWDPLRGSLIRISPSKLIFIVILTVFALLVGEPFLVL